MVLVESLLFSQTVHKTPIMNQKSLSSCRCFLCVNLVISSFIRICTIGQPPRPVLPNLWHKENLGYYLRAVPSQAYSHGFLQARAVGYKFKSNVFPPKAQWHGHNCFGPPVVLSHFLLCHYSMTFVWCVRKLVFGDRVFPIAQTGPEFHNSSASGSWVIGIAGLHHRLSFQKRFQRD